MAKTTILNDIKSNDTNLTHEITEIENIINMLNSLVGGSYLRADQEMIELCQRAISKLKNAVGNLRSAQDLSRQLDITTEVPDNEY